MINVPDFEEVYRSMQPEDQEFSAGLLKEYPALFRRGEFSVVWSAEYFGLQALGRYLVQQAMTELKESYRLHIVVFTFRDSDESYANRLALGMAGVSEFRCSRHIIPSQERSELSTAFEHVRKQINESDIEVINACGMTLEDMRDRLVELRSDFGISMVLIDSLIDCSVRGGGCDRCGWSAVGARLSQLAQEFNAPVIALGVLEDRTRSLYDHFLPFGGLLRYSDGIYHMYRGDLSDGENRHVIAMFIEDVRHGTIDRYKFAMHFDFSLGLMYDCDPWEQPREKLKDEQESELVQDEP